MPNIISAVTRHARNQTLRDIEEMASAGLSTLVLIMSPSDRPSTTELDRARSLMTSLRNSFFDIYFAYAAQELIDFQNISEYLDYSEIFLRVILLTDNLCRYNCVYIVFIIKLDDKADGK